MIRSRRNTSFQTKSSLQQSKQSLSQNQKKYRCGCCNDKKYHDYNRENRLRRQSASSKRLNLTTRQPSCYHFEAKSSNFSNTELICSLDNYEVMAKNPLDSKNLPAILQSSHLYEQHTKKDNNSNVKTPKVDIKSYCKNLFSSHKKRIIRNRIEVSLHDNRYYIEFQSSQRMKLAIGELKLLIQNSQKNRPNIKLLTDN